MKKLILNVLAGLAITSPAYPFNLSFLDYSSVSYFTEADSKMSENAGLKALDHARDNTKVSWSNPNTGAHGYFIPSNTTTKNGRTCRKLTIFNEAHHVTGQSSYPFCKINGEWKTI